MEVQFSFDESVVIVEVGISFGEFCNEIMGFLIVFIIILFIVGGGWFVIFSVFIIMLFGVENFYVIIINECSNYGNVNWVNVFMVFNVLVKIFVVSVLYGMLYFFDFNSNFSIIISNKYIDNLNMCLLNECFIFIEFCKNWFFIIKIEII